MRGAGKADIAVLAALVIILKITYLLSIFKLKANPGKVYYFLCNKIPPEVTCRVTCGVRIQRLGPDLGLAKGRVNLELHE